MSHCHRAAGNGEILIDLLCYGGCQIKLTYPLTKSALYICLQFFNTSSYVFLHEHEHEQ